MLSVFPKKQKKRSKSRKSAVQEATRNAILVPFKVMETAFLGFRTDKGNGRKGKSQFSD